MEDVHSNPLFKALLKDHKDFYEKLFVGKNWMLCLPKSEVIKMKIDSHFVRQHILRPEGNNEGGVGAMMSSSSHSCSSLSSSSSSSSPPGSRFANLNNHPVEVNDVFVRVMDLPSGSSSSSASSSTSSSPSQPSSAPSVSKRVAQCSLLYTETYYDDDFRSFLVLHIDTVLLKANDGNTDSKKTRHGGGSSDKKLSSSSNSTAAGEAKTFSVPIERRTRKEHEWCLRTILGPKVWSDAKMFLKEFCHSLRKGLDAAQKIELTQVTTAIQNAIKHILTLSPSSSPESTLQVMVASLHGYLLDIIYPSVVEHRNKIPGHQRSNEAIDKVLGYVSELDMDVLKIRRSLQCDPRAAVAIVKQMTNAMTPAGKLACMQDAFWLLARCIDLKYLERRLQRRNPLVKLRFKKKPFGIIVAQTSDGKRALKPGPIRCTRRRSVEVMRKVYFKRFHGEQLCPIMRSLRLEVFESAIDRGFNDATPRPGWRLIDVNGESVRGLRQEQLISMVKAAGLPAVLTFTTGSNECDNDDDEEDNDRRQVNRGGGGSTNGSRAAADNRKSSNENQGSDDTKSQGKSLKLQELGFSPMSPPTPPPLPPKSTWGKSGAASSRFKVANAIAERQNKGSSEPRLSPPSSSVQDTSPTSASPPPLRPVPFPAPSLNRDSGVNTVNNNTRLSILSTSSAPPNPPPSSYDSEYSLLKQQPDKVYVEGTTASSSNVSVSSIKRKPGNAAVSTSAPAGTSAAESRDKKQQQQQQQQPPSSSLSSSSTSANPPLQSSKKNNNGVSSSSSNSSSSNSSQQQQQQQQQQPEGQEEEEKSSRDDPAGTAPDAGGVRSRRSSTNGSILPQWAEGTTAIRGAAAAAAAAAAGVSSSSGDIPPRNDGEQEEEEEGKGGSSSSSGRRRYSARDKSRADSITSITSALEEAAVAEDKEGAEGAVLSADDQLLYFVFLLAQARPQHLYTDLQMILHLTPEFPLTDPPLPHTAASLHAAVELILSGRLPTPIQQKLLNFLLSATGEEEEEEEEEGGDGHVTGAGTESNHNPSNEANDHTPTITAAISDEKLKHGGDSSNSNSSSMGRGGGGETVEEPNVHNKSVGLVGNVSGEVTKQGRANNHLDRHDHNPNHVKKPNGGKGNICESSMEKKSNRTMPSSIVGMPNRTSEKEEEEEIFGRTNNRANGISSSSSSSSNEFRHNDDNDVNRTQKSNASGIIDTKEGERGGGAKNIRNGSANSMRGSIENSKNPGRRRRRYTAIAVGRGGGARAPLRRNSVQSASTTQLHRLSTDIDPLEAFTRLARMRRKSQVQQRSKMPKNYASATTSTSSDSNSSTVDSSFRNRRESRSSERSKSSTRPPPLTVAIDGGDGGRENGSTASSPTQSSQSP